MTLFTAVVLAADRSSGDPVAQAAGVACKALTPVGGSPMVIRVLKTLELADTIGTRMLCGPSWAVVEQEPELQTAITAGRLKWIENQATPSSSAYAAMQSIPETELVLLTTADHALLTPRIVDFFCEQARTGGCDLVVALAPHELIAAAYPDMKRTVIKLRDGGYCGCNLFAFLTPRARIAADFWRRIEDQRKRPLRVIGLLGWMAVIRYLVGRLTLNEGLERLSRRMGLKIGVVIMPFPQAAVDIDTVSDWRFAQARVNENAD